MKEILKKLELVKYIKVDTTIGGGLKEAVFLNPITLDVKKIVVDDMENEYGTGFIENRITLDELQSIEKWVVKESANRFYKKVILGIVESGDLAKIIKGRTHEIGSIHKIQSLRNIKCGYKKVEYAYFEDGTKISTFNIENLDKSLYREFLKSEESPTLTKFNNYKKIVYKISNI